MMRFILILNAIILFNDINCQVMCLPPNSGQTNNGSGLAPATTSKSMSEMKTIRVNFHFMLKNDGTGNFTETSDGDGRNFSGYQLARELLSIINSYSNSNESPNIPTGNSLQVLPKNYKFVLDAVYFVKDNNYYNYNGGNPFSPYGKDKHHVMNIFIQHDPSIGGGYASDITSLSGNKFTATAGFWRKYKQYYEDGLPISSHLWSHGGTLAHELAHLLTLSHTVSWNWGTACPTNCNNGSVNSGCDDGCSDTPTANEIMMANSCSQHPHCGWQEGSNLDCSNNLMDYTNGSALTPCQLNRIHSALEGGLKSYLSCIAVKTNLAITTFGYPKTSYFGKVITVGNATTESKLSLGQKVEMYFSESVDLENFTVRDDSPLDIYYEAPCNY